MVCGPAESAEVENVATPAALSVPVPSEVEPSRKVTVPVGFAVPLAGVTVAVNVILAPVLAVAGPVSAVVVEINGAAEMTTLRVLDVLGEKFVSPAYCTEIRCEPAASELVVKLAAPAASVAVPNDVA